MKAHYNEAAAQIVAGLERSGYVQMHDEDDRLTSIEFLAAQIEKAAIYTFKLSDS